MPTIYGMSYRHGDITSYKKNYLLYPLVTDMSILYALRTVAPVFDANMFIIYGSENGYDADQLSVSELTELAAIYKKQIGTFVDNKVKTKIKEIIVRWWKFIIGNNYVFSLPEPQYKQFISVANNIDVIKYRFNNLNTEAIGSCIEAAHREFVAVSSNRLSGLQYEDIPVDPKICEKFFQTLFDWTSLNIAERFNDVSQRRVINQQLTYMAAGFLKFLCRGAKAENYEHFDCVEETYNTYFHPMFKDEPTSVQEYIRKSRTLQPCHSLALDTKWIDSLIVSRTPIIRENQASILAHLLICGKTSDDRLKKAKRNMTEFCDASGGERPTCLF